MGIDKISIFAPVVGHITDYPFAKIGISCRPRNKISTKSNIKNKAMTKEEFLKLTGIRQMSDPDYEKVEHAYMSVPDMDKQTFCELYVNNQPELLSTMANVLEREKTEKKAVSNVSKT